MKKNEETAPLCGCGCGQSVRRSRNYEGWSIYISGHNPPVIKPLASRFWSKVKISGMFDCWEWKASLRLGYGLFWKNGGHVSAHRMSWELTRGIIPKGKLVLHNCDNPACVNPGHLFLGDGQENSSDMVIKGRSCRGEAKPNAKLTEGKVRQVRNWYTGGSRVVDIARKLNVSHGLISGIVHGRTWRHVL